MEIESGDTTTHIDGSSGDMNGQDARNEVKCLPAEHYRHFLSKVASDLKLTPIRNLIPLESTPGIISLLAGKPNESMFPITSISFTANSPHDFSKEVTGSVAPPDLTEGLQYGPTTGLKKMHDWIMGLQERVHKRRGGEGWRCTVGVGSQDLLFKAVIMLLDHGDSIFIESPAYAGMIPVFASLHCEQVEVETDSKGLNPELLRKLLEKWPAGKPKPKLLYTVPYGGNPAGMTTTTERRREILALAREHEFLIIEDDPYYWLYYSDDERPPSYFQLELEQPEVGRVLRFDSFSKIISAGMRFGFASGPKAIIDAIDVQTGSSNLQPSSLIQVIMLALVEPWGYDGFEAFTRNVSNFYKKKRNIFEEALQEHLGDVAEWSTPESGLFFWVKLLLKPHGDGESDSNDLIASKAFRNGVIALPGTVFLPNGQKSAYVRLSFSLLPEELVHEALRRLKAVIVKERDRGRDAEGPFDSYQAVRR
ncbi:PLP-dependent transferase [Gyrodon lividus]|nr:PLP-dependent transferase [Gyrodon lividus]